MGTTEKIFRYKLDFYYQQALLYFAALVGYAGIKGSFVEDEFIFVFKDPILYIIVFFVGFSLVGLLLNKLRDRKLIITEDKLIFTNKYRERVIPITEIEWLHIGRERMVQTSGRFQVIVFKVKGRKRFFRIRVGRYDHQKELVAEMQRISAHVPKYKGKRIGMGKTARM